LASNLIIIIIFRSQWCGIPWSVHDEEDAMVHGTQEVRPAAALKHCSGGFLEIGTGLSVGFETADEPRFMCPFIKVSSSGGPLPTDVPIRAFS
jgi:hypothetical protein